MAQAKTALYNRSMLAALTLARSTHFHTDYGKRERSHKRDTQNHISEIDVAKARRKEPKSAIWDMYPNRDYFPRRITSLFISRITPSDSYQINHHNA